MASEIKLIMSPYLEDEELQKVRALEKKCIALDGHTLKLELDYKQSMANELSMDSAHMNEFMCKIEDQVIAYAGICGFDGMTLEVNGMVDPSYRRQGLFTTLIDFVIDEVNTRKEETLLLLADSESLSGQAFIKTLEVAYQHSEYEMFLEMKKPISFDKRGLTFRKASNDDADEIVNQNAVYFDKAVEEIDMPLPETEEKRGMTIYLAELEDLTIGKVNIEIFKGVAGLFGLGVKPDYRGKGYGREILEFAVTKAIELGAEGVMLQVEAENDRALSLYKSCGFKIASKMDYFKFQ